MKKILLGLVCLMVLAAADPVAAQDDISPKGIVIIPAIGMIQVVYEAPIVNRAHDVFWAGDSVYHLEDTAWLEDERGIALAGHNPGVFGRLGELRKGDVVVVLDTQRIEVYRITGAYLVPVSGVGWIYSSSEIVTLITCDGEERLVVQAFRE